MLNWRNTDAILLKVGGNYLAFGNQKTEILKIDENKNFNWSVIEPCFEFYHGKWITGESFDINEEYVLLIGGFIDYSKKSLQNVFKFNGTWFVFKQLNKPRELFQSIYWNGTVKLTLCYWWMVLYRRQLWKYKNGDLEYKRIFRSIQNRRKLVGTFQLEVTTFIHCSWFILSRSLKKFLSCYQLHSMYN